MKLWKIEKCEQVPECPGCEGPIAAYHTEHHVISKDEQFGLAIANDLASLNEGNEILLRITLLDEDVKIEDTN